MGGGSSPYSGAQGASFASAAAPYLPPPAPAPPDPYDRYLLHQHNLHPHHHHHHPPHHYSLHHYDVLPPPPPQPTTATRERYDSYQAAPAVAAAGMGGPGDPYMRRDLGYHHHYRLPPYPPGAAPPYTPQGGGTPLTRRQQPQRRCCSSNTSSYHHHHHHSHSHHQHATGGHHGGGASLQSPLLTPRSSPGLRGGQGPTASSQQQQQTSSGSSSSSIVEYLGSSGGRYVSTTPPLSSQSRCVNSDVNERLRAMTSCGNSDVNERLRAMTSCGNGDVNERLRAMSSCGNSDVNERLRAMTSCGSSDVNERLRAMTSCGNSDVNERLRAMTSSAGQLCCTPRRPQQILAPTAQQQSSHHNSVWRSVGQSPPSPTPPSAPSAASISPPPAPTSPGVMEPISPVPMQQQPPSHHHHHHHYHQHHHHQPPMQIMPPVPTTVQLPQSQPTAAAPTTIYQRSVSVPVAVPVTSAAAVSNGDQEPVMMRRPHQLQHQQSVPVTQEEVVATRRRVYPTASMTELVKNYIKRETAVFFGVDESSEEVERARWLERRKRLATRKYGQLRQEYQLPAPGAAGLSASGAGGQASGPASAQPDVLPTGRDELDSSSRTETAQLRRKPSVAKMTFSGVAYVVATLSRHKPRQTSLSRQMSRSYPPSTVPHTPTSPLDDEVFFDRVSTSEATQLNQAGDYNNSSSTAGNQDHTQWTALASDIPDTIDDPGRRDRLGSWRRAPPPERERAWVGGRGGGEGGPDGAGGHFGASRIHGQILDTATDNSNRRQYGMGVVGRFFGRSLKRSVMNREPVRTQLEDLEDHRPFFTYWVTTVQILILLISLWCYGLGPVGIHLTHQSGLVLVTSLSLQQVEYMEPANFWIGPRAADLIHLGAKFAPCMRKDAKIMKEIEKEREKERETACCIRNDDSGCVQSSKQDCSISSRNQHLQGLRPTDTISTWKKWSAGDSGPGGRLSGSVCGLDPKYCEAPASAPPYEWPDDITKWPICRKSYPPSGGSTRLVGGGGGVIGGGGANDKLAAEHMVCEVIGHPCCIGIHGKCEIKTREYCDFVHGYFHEEASLCSQVSCLDNVCGMIPFYSPEVPDQFYRLWTSLFLHAGVLHLAITLVIQWFLMRDLEKLTGSLRIMIIYMGSGVAGNLASAIFVPYRAEVGPAGGQFGLLACLIVEVLNSWPMLRQPQAALAKLLAITALLFLFGLLPWIDNFAHLFGFVFGFLLSYALLPFVSFGDYDRQKKIFLIWVCLVVSVLLLLLLVLLFYVIPIYDCQACGYLTCLPLTRDLCATQNINLKRSGLDSGPISGNAGDSPHSASLAAV